MSTPDRLGIDTLVVPGEARNVAGHVPAPKHALELPVHHVPTPGVSAAVIKHPAAPTLPDLLDPHAATTWLNQMANEYFSAPIGSPESPAASTRSPDAGTITPISEPGATAVQTAVPSPAADRRNDSHLALPGSPVPDGPTGHGWNGLAPGAPARADGPTATPSWDVPPNLSVWNNDGVLPAPFVPLAFPLLDAASPSSPPSTEGPSSFSFPGTELSPTAHGYVHPKAEPFDPHALRREFPILEERVNNRRLVWLDNAATTQKPRAVIERLTAYYEHENSNIHRAAHTLAARATDAYEDARDTVRRFINAPQARDIIFVRGATEGINLVAQSWGRRHISTGDEIVITWLEHHANIVPWQQLCAEKGARLRVAPVDHRGQIILEEYEKLLNPKTRFVSLTQVSNALGTITPAQEMVALAHRHGAMVLVDGAQSVSHQPTDVQALGCDFFVFSGHKVFAPTGIGAVYGRSELLDEMPPWQGGGNMIQDVTFEKTVFNPAPARFEAGTGNIADAVGLGAALKWLTKVGLPNVERYEHELLGYATERLQTVPGLTLIGTAPEKAGVLSFTLAGQKTQEVGGMLDQEGIAVRSGHHCAQPILRRFGVEATVRASLAPYNTCEDIDALVAALLRIQERR